MTTKEFKKKHSSKLVGEAEKGSQGEEDVQQGHEPGGQNSGWWTGWPHISMRISQEEQLGRETDPPTQGSSVGNLKLQNLWL